MPTTKANQQKIEKIEADIEVIKTNHLTHIESSIHRMEKTIDRMDNRMWALIFIVVGSAIGSMFV